MRSRDPMKKLLTEKIEDALRGSKLGDFEHHVQIARPIWGTGPTGHIDGVLNVLVSRPQMRDRHFTIKVTAKQDGWQ